MDLKHFFFTLAGVFLLVLPLSSQEVVDFDAKAWNWKENRNEFARIFSGETDLAIRNMESMLEKKGEDPEIFYGLCVAYYFQKKNEKGLLYFQKAREAGLPLERFMAGPRDVLKSLYKSPQFREQAKGKELIHGPMLGCMTDSSVKVWIRTFHEVPFTVKVATDPFMVNKTGIYKGYTSAAKDYTGIVRINGLQPHTSYYYTLEVKGKQVPLIKLFRTFPSPGTPTAVKIAFGGGAAYTPTREKIWRVIKSNHPDAFIGMGDNVYIDHPKLPVVQRFCYYQREAVQTFRRLTGAVPYFSVWDDHDFGVNDSYGGPDRFKPAWKVKVLQVYKENTVNPAYGGGKENPGTWYSVNMGTVDFFMMDTRYYRTPSYVDKKVAAKSPPRNMLGKIQMEWLQNGLKASKATFKVIVSSIPWSDDAKDAMEGRYDTWRGYPKERQEIFDYLTTNNIAGVILLSADRHRLDGWRHDRPGDYPLYEFTSSRLTDIHYHPLRPGALFGYNEKNGFGMLEFHPEAIHPYVVFKIINIDNKLIDQIRIYRYQLEKGFVKKK